MLHLKSTQTLKFLKHVHPNAYILHLITAYIRQKYWRVRFRDMTVNWHQHFKARKWLTMSTSKANWWGFTLCVRVSMYSVALRIWKELWWIWMGPLFHRLGHCFTEMDKQMQEWETQVSVKMFILCCYYKYNFVNL